jgi:hypothetical protein
MCHYLKTFVILCHFSKNKSSYIQYTQHCMIYKDIFVWISSIVKTQNTFGSDKQDIDNATNN